MGFMEFIGGRRAQAGSSEAAAGAAGRRHRHRGCGRQRRRRVRGRPSPGEGTPAGPRKGMGGGPEPARPPPGLRHRDLAFCPGLARGAGRHAPAPSVGRGCPWSRRKRPPPPRPPKKSPRAQTTHAHGPPRPPRGRGHSPVAAGGGNRGDFPGRDRGGGEDAAPRPGISPRTRPGAARGISSPGRQRGPVGSPRRFRFPPAPRGGGRDGAATGRSGGGGGGNGTAPAPSRAYPGHSGRCHQPRAPTAPPSPFPAAGPVAPRGQAPRPGRAGPAARPPTLPWQPPPPPPGTARGVGWGARGAIFSRGAGLRTGTRPSRRCPSLPVPARPGAARTHRRERPKMALAAPGARGCAEAARDFQPARGPGSMAAAAARGGGRRGTGRGARGRGGAGRAGPSRAEPSRTGPGRAERAPPPPPPPPPRTMGPRAHQYARAALPRPAPPRQARAAEHRAGE